jgi:hypothetical protein
LRSRPTKPTLEPAETSPEFRRIIVDGMIGYMSSIGLKVLVFSNKDIYDGVMSADPFDFDQKRVKRMTECQLIMNPAVVKYVHTFLGERLEEYEACYGEIPTNEVFETRNRNIFSPKVLMI